jgi:hypothetical protein
MEHGGHMAVADRYIKLIERDAQDTLERNRAALAASQQSVGKLREVRERSHRRVKVVTRRLKEAGISVDGD